VPPEDGCLLDVDPDGGPPGADAEVGELDDVEVDEDVLEDVDGDGDEEEEVEGHGVLDDALGEDDEDAAGGHGVLEDALGEDDEDAEVDGVDVVGLLDGGGTLWSAPPVPPVDRANQVPVAGS
jgi:hypothetical protein